PSRDHRTSVATLRKMASSRTVTRRVALAAVSTGAVSPAGIGGATAATLQAQAETAPEATAARATRRVIVREEVILRCFPTVVRWFLLCMCPLLVEIGRAHV